MRYINNQIPENIKKTFESSSKFSVNFLTSSDSKKIVTKINIIRDKSKRTSLLNIVFKFLYEKVYYIYE